MAVLTSSQQKDIKHDVDTTQVQFGPFRGVATMLIMGSTPPVSWDKSCPTFLKSLVMSSCRDMTSRVVMAMSAAMATSAVVMATTWFMWSVRVVAV